MDDQFLQHCAVFRPGISLQSKHHRQILWPQESRWMLSMRGGGWAGTVTRQVEWLTTRRQQSWKIANSLLPERKRSPHFRNTFSPTCNAERLFSVSYILMTYLRSTTNDETEMILLLLLYNQYTVYSFRICDIEGVIDGFVVKSAFDVKDVLSSLNTCWLFVSSHFGVRFLIIREFGAIADPFQKSCERACNGYDAVVALVRCPH